MKFSDYNKQCREYCLLWILIILITFGIMYYFGWRAPASGLPWKSLIIGYSGPIFSSIITQWFFNNYLKK